MNNFQKIRSNFFVIENLKICFSQKFKMTDIGSILYYFDIKINIFKNKIITCKNLISKTCLTDIK